MKTLVITPTYNEAETVTSLIPRILAVECSGRSIDVLVIDDASPDGTGDVVAAMARTDERIHLLRRPRKLGLGTAYAEGFRFALERNYELIVQMDADLSHNPRYLPEFFRKVSEFDLVVGSRYLQGISIVNWPFWRLAVSYFGNFLARRLTGVPLTDLTSGYKCFRIEILKGMDLDRLRCSGYGFQIEFAYRTRERGFRVGEIPIIFVERYGGQSKMTVAIAVEALFLIIRLWCSRALRAFEGTALQGSSRKRPAHLPPVAAETHRNALSDGVIAGIKASRLRHHDVALPEIEEAVEEHVARPRTSTGAR